MEESRIEEILREAEYRYNWLMNSVVGIKDYTLENLPQDHLADFKSGGLYEFLPYRRELGGQIIFKCIKDGERVYFDEKYRVYTKESFYGIERRDNLAYVGGIDKCIYSRTSEDSVILDIGCGTAKYLAPVNSSKRTILAMDMSRDVIEENKGIKELDRIHFFPGDALDLSYIKDAEVDYVTGINILNVVSPEDVVRILSQGYRIARRGLLFGFTLPAKCDFWTAIPKEQAERIERGANDPSAPIEDRVLVAEQGFLGQMNLFGFVKNLCREWNWSCRVFRFLDRYIVDSDAFFKTDDSDYIGYGNNSILKILEYPSRPAANIKDVGEGNFLIHAIGYGMEVYFLSGEELKVCPESILGKGEGLYYFEDDCDFQSIKISHEINHSIDYWGLPFDKIK